MGLCLYLSLTILKNYLADFDRTFIASFPINSIPTVPTDYILSRYDIRALSSEHTYGANKRIALSLSETEYAVYLLEICSNYAAEETSILLVLHKRLGLVTAKLSIFDVCNSGSVNTYFLHCLHHLP